MKAKVVYITSRGGTHPIHKAYADSINADFQFIDFRLRWHDVKTSRLKKYLSWVICALSFPNRKKYDIFLVSGQHVMPVLMRLFFRLRKDQKLVCFHANEGLYFTYSEKYPFINRLLIRKILPLYDAHICIGKMQADLLRIVSDDKAKNVYQIFNGVAESKSQVWSALKPNLESKKILFVGNLYAGWRMHYKGIDLMIESVIWLLKNGYEDIEFYLVGEYDENFLSYFNATVPEKLKKNFFLEGKQDITKYFSLCGLYLHCARGDAFPTTVIEATAAGLPAIVSEWTGTKEIIEKISPALIVSTDSDKLSEAISDYFSQNKIYREEISKKCKEVAKEYIDKNAIELFQSTIESIYQIK